MNEVKKRDRSEEGNLYISKQHKEKLKSYVAKTGRTMRKETEMWIDSLVQFK